MGGQPSARPYRVSRMLLSAILAAVPAVEQLFDSGACHPIGVGNLHCPLALLVALLYIVDRVSVACNGR